MYFVVNSALRLPPSNFCLRTSAFCLLVYVTDANGHQVRKTTITNPDGGTRMETYYLDGTLQSVTGTAVHPVRYTCDSGAREIKLNPGGYTGTSEYKTSPN